MMYSHFGSSAKLPKKREKKRMQVREPSVLRSDKHLRWIRSLQCVVPSCTTGQKVVAAHIRAGLPPGEMPGTAIKPADCWVFPACVFHHGQEHMGTKSFQREYEIDLVQIAHGLALQSPCPDIRAKAKSITNI